jgi:hypothetical protein
MAPQPVIGRGFRSRSVDGYELYISDVELRRPQRHTVAPLSVHGTVAYTAIDLQPYSAYRAHVTARTAVGEGPGSATVRFRTMETGEQQKYDN